MSRYRSQARDVSNRSTVVRAVLERASTPSCQFMRGGAIAFSTGAVYEVMPVTRCKRNAFVPFLYGRDDARPREANNAILQEGEETQRPRHVTSGVS